MKAMIKFSDNIIKIKSSKLSLWLMTFLGILMLLSGLFLFGEKYPYYHILFSTGLIFTSAGLLFFVNSKYYKIYINNEPGYISILESSIRTISPVRIPINLYTHVTIQTKIRQGITKNILPIFEILLTNDFGSTLYISEFRKKEKAIIFAKELQKILGIDFSIDQIFIKKNVKLDDIDVSKLELVPLKKSTLKIQSNETSTLLTWKSKFNPLHYLFILTILYGIYHLLNFFIFPVYFSGFDNLLLELFFYSLSGIAIIAIIIDSKKSYFLYISPSSISYYSKFIWKWVGFKKIKKTELGSVINSLNMNNETIRIISKEGLKAKNNIVQNLKDNKKLTNTAISYLMTFKNESIEIKTSALSITEKLFIEKMILKV